MNAVILLGREWILYDVKDALFLDDESLRSQVNRYQPGGITELVMMHYPSYLSSLIGPQCEPLCKELDSKVNKHCGISF
jgi:hypothetical protein